MPWLNGDRNEEHSRIAGLADHGPGIAIGTWDLAKPRRDAAAERGHFDAGDLAGTKAKWAPAIVAAVALTDGRPGIYAAKAGTADTEGFEDIADWHETLANAAGFVGGGRGASPGTGDDSEWGRFSMAASSTRIPVIVAGQSANPNSRAGADLDAGHALGMVRAKAPIGRRASKVYSTAARPNARIWSRQLGSTAGQDIERPHRNGFTGAEKGSPHVGGRSSAASRPSAVTM